jgi:hypothetical protein
MRHLNAYQKGELKDPETGLSHLAHASCGLMMLLEFEQTGIGENDVYWASTNTLKQQKDCTCMYVITTTIGNTSSESHERTCPLYNKNQQNNNVTATQFKPGQVVKHRYMNNTAILVSPGTFKTATEDLRVWTVKLPNSQETWIEEDFELA